MTKQKKKKIVKFSIFYSPFDIAKKFFLFFFFSFFLSFLTFWIEYVPLFSYIPLLFLHWSSRLELQNTPTASLQRCKTSPNTKQPDGEAPVMLELWGMQRTPLMPSLSGPLLPGVAVPDWVLSMGQIELFDIENMHLCLIKLFEIELSLHLTTSKQMDV